MEKNKATIEEILGKKEPCYFSINGINHFKYGECRNCLNYNIKCSNYLSTLSSVMVAHKPHELKDGQFESAERDINKVILRNETQIKKNDKILNRPFFWYHSSIHEPILPRRRYKTLIWRANDGGCV